jgi:hypothetical protein
MPRNHKWFPEFSEEKNTHYDVCTVCGLRKRLVKYYVSTGYVRKLYKETKEIFIKGKWELVTSLPDCKPLV